jgi:hypothetical protein
MTVSDLGIFVDPALHHRRVPARLKVIDEKE